MARYRTIASLPHFVRRAFSSRDDGASFLIRCDRCSAAWRLQKPAEGSWPLRLLDHAAKHDHDESLATGKPDLTCDCAGCRALRFNLGYFERECDVCLDRFNALPNDPCPNCEEDES